MATIPLNYHQVSQNYARERDEIMLQIQNSRSQHRNIAPEDLTWSIQWVTQINGLMTLGDMVQNIQQGRRRPEPESINHFSLQASYRQLYKSVRLNREPVEFAQQARNQAAARENTQQRLANSLREANNSPQRLWLRIRAQGNRNIPTIHAFPILAGVRDGRGSVIIVTDNYEGGMSVFKLDNNLIAQWMDKSDADRMVDFFNNNEAGTRQRVGRRTLTSLSSEEIRELTDFNTYREEVEALLENMEGLRGFRVGGGGIIPLDMFPEDEFDDDPEDGE